MDLNDFVDETYLISLKSDYTRRDLSLESLDREDIGYTRADGIYGNILISLLRDSMFNYNPMDNRQNTLGCALAHLNVIEDARRKGHRRILTLEDDIEIYQDWRSVWEEFSSQDFIKDEDFDILYLGWVPLINEGTHWSYRHIDMINSCTSRARGYTGGHAYIWTEHIMDELISSVQKHGILYEVDHFVERFIQPRGRCYGVVPQIFCFRSVDSSRTSMEAEDAIKNRSIYTEYASPKEYN